MLSLLFILVSLFIIRLLSSRRVSFSILFLAYLYHFIFINFYYFILSSSSDALGFYYHHASSAIVDFKIGGFFIAYLMHFPVKYLSASLYDMFILFGSLGYFGLVINYIAIKKYLDITNKRSKQIMLLLLFLPGLNLWTSAPGKDSFIFLFISLVFYSLFDIKKRKYILIISIIFISMTRPQIGAVITVSLIFSLIFHGNIDKVKKTILLVFLLSISIPAIPYVLSYVGLQDQSLSAVQDYMSTRAGYNQGGGSSINISDANFFVKIFGYLFRPLFFDASGIMGVLISIEHLIYLCITGSLLFSSRYINYIYTKSTFIEKFFLVYFILMSIILSSITANLGIAMRQKTMFIVVIIFLFLIRQACLLKNNERLS